MTLRFVNWILLVIAAIIMSTVLAHAETQKDAVLDCFSDMERGVAWETCLETMFAPCAGEDVGSEAHLGCLTKERQYWRDAKFKAETSVLARLSEAGMTELSGLMLAWPKFVDDKCKAVAESRATISSDAASLGCQISELALLTNEMTACLNGASSEAYCQLRDE